MQESMLATLLPAGVGPGIALFLTLASFFTSGLTAAFGIGGGVALLGLMGYFLPVAALIPVHGIVQLGSNAGRFYVQRAHVMWVALAWFLAGAALGALAGARFVVSLEDWVLKTALGIFILFVTWMKFPALARGGPAVFLSGGALTTFLTMFFGATGPLTAAFLEKAATERRNYVATHAAAMTFQHLFKAVAFGFAGFAFFEWAPLVAAMIATGLAGTIAGSRLLARMPEAGFRQAFKWLMTALALDLARRGIMAFPA